MKYVAIALLAVIPALADWRWEGREQAREAMAEATARAGGSQARGSAGPARHAAGNGVGKSRMAQ